MVIDWAPVKALENNVTLTEEVIALWSGGKDSALALYEILKTGGFEVVELLTTRRESQNLA